MECVFFMNFLEIFENECASVKDYADIDKYKLTPRAFNMDCTWSFFDHILFILTNNGKSLTLAIEDFVEDYFDDDESKLITKEAVSKQRQKFKSNIFKDMNKNLVKKILKSNEYKYHRNGKMLLIIDGSRSEIPNTPESKKWAEIKEDSLTNRKAARTLFSTVIDGHYGFVYDSILGKSTSNEREMLKQHILNLKDMIDFENVILVIDAGYYSLELKLFLEKHGIDYIFRLSPTTYEDEISKMESMDEKVKIKINGSRRRSVHEEDLKKEAEQLQFIEPRILKIPILNEDDEEDELILLTNLEPEEFSYIEIAETYRDRWEIEVNYDRLKNKANLENYSGKLELTISQDFYATIYIFNLALILRNNIHKHLERKNKKKREKENKEYRTNMSTLMGRVKRKLLRLFTSSRSEVKKIYERIIRRGMKDTYLHDFNRPKIKWHKKIFIGKWRYNQRPNG